MDAVRIGEVAQQVATAAPAAPSPAESGNAIGAKCRSSAATTICLTNRPAGPWTREGIPPALWRVIERLAAGEAPWPLFLYGPPGTGKTFAARWLAEAVAWPPLPDDDRRWNHRVCVRPGVYFTVEALVDQVVRGSYPPWHEVAGAEMAALDELASRQTVSDVHYQSVLRFTSARDERPGRAAVYVSNVEPDAIGRTYDDRIASRILCGTVFRLTGPDRRFLS